MFIQIFYLNKKIMKCKLPNREGEIEIFLDFEYRTAKLKQQNVRNFKTRRKFLF